MTGTNAAQLSNWTMNDLLQMNGNETKVNAACSPTKRTSSRSRAQQQQPQMSESVTHVNHKRSSPLESSINKRLKSNSTVSTFNRDQSTSRPMGNTIQQQSFSLQNSDTVQQQQQKSPHLLQHLMAPSPDRVRKYTGPANKSTSDKSTNNDAQWNLNIGYDESKTQSSDSVLKNLLVSGCDISAGYVCHVPVRLRKLAKA